MSLAKIKIGDHAPEIINAIIEIPKGSHTKYEYDELNDVIKLNRVLHSPVYYPTEYGFIPQTRSEDGDHLDVLVLVSDPLFPGCVLEVKPIGVLYMDDGGKDEKIIAVAAKDPVLSEYKDIEDLDKFFRKEIHHFFESYKDLENKTVKVHHWHGKNQALEVIQKANIKYNQEIIG
jgi:inorganic pyrophosphatase